jgi:hypothetical protein
MTDFKPSQKSAQRVADKIGAAADTAGAEVLNVDTGTGDSTVAVVFTKDAWGKFIMLLLDDAFKP